MVRLPQWHWGQYNVLTLFGKENFSRRQFRTRERKKRIRNIKCDIVLVLMGKKSRENTKEEIRRMNRERKKRKRQQRNLEKERTLVSELRKEKDRLARQQQICEYLSRKYYDRWRSLLSREEASRKAVNSILGQPVTQRKVCFFVNFSGPKQ